MPQGSPGTRPVRSHLLALALGAVLPTAAFGAVVALRLAHEQQAATERRLAERARTLAAALDADLGAEILALKTLSFSEALERGNLEAFREEAVRVDLARPGWLAIALFAPGPRRVLDSRGGEHRPFRQPELVQRTIRTGEAAVGDFAVTPERPPSYAVCVAVKVQRAPHALCAIGSVARISELVDLASLSPDEWTRTVVDTHGVIIARSREGESRVGTRASDTFLAGTAGAREGVFRSVALGTDMPTYVAFSRSVISGWTTAVVASLDVVQAPVRRSAALLGVMGVALVGLGIAAAWLLSRRFTLALGSAGQAAAALAEGSRRDVSAHGIAEVARLGESLGRTADLLEQRGQEVAEHLARADAARAQAEAASRAKDEFLAMLGHELRNPLSPIVTALRLLGARGAPFGRELRVVERQVEHLVRLVDDLLDVSRVTRGKVELALERLELSGPVHRAVEMASPLLEQRRHRLELAVPEGLRVRADAVRLAQVISNLLTNAARYTPPGGRVVVRASRAAGEVALEVADDGQGISPELLPRVFDLFMQGPRDPDRHEGGLGIGLALVKSLVELHGGRVEARSDGPGRGSTFRIVLPEAAPGADAPRAPPRLPPAPSRRRLRVLVVDDNADAAVLLGEFLGRAGHEVLVAHDAPGALAAVEGAAPDVAVLDIGLPVIDGYELALRLRARLGEDGPAFIGVTGYGQARDRARSEAAGFAHHFVKPADPPELLAAIEAAGDSVRQRRALARPSAATAEAAVRPEGGDFANPRSVR